MRAQVRIFYCLIENQLCKIQSHFQIEFVFYGKGQKHKLFYRLRHVSIEDFDAELNIAMQNGFISVERKENLFAILEKSCE